MNAEIVTIGDEILIGQVTDTNSGWIASELNKIGVEVKRIRAIKDNREDILKNVSEAIESSSIILITGGLGPTKDDITKITLCEYFESKLYFDEEVCKQLQSFFDSRGKKLSELNRKQAELPDACVPISNTIGTAPGMLFQKKDKIIISMPGVPYEMKEMMKQSVLPLLQKKAGPNRILQHTILTSGIAESDLAELIADWENNLPQNFSLAYLPQPGIVRLRITGKGEELVVKQEMEKRINKLESIASDFVFGHGEDTLEKVVGELLKKNKFTLSTAESCTGGYIAHLLTSISGSSDYFMGSVVSYSNDLKEKLLQVKSDDLKTYGAVSEQVVKQMAEGARKNLKTDYAIATSGIAGPTGGTKEKPVGTIWIAVTTPSKTICKKLQLGNNRLVNIQATSAAALNLLRKELI